jgi:peptide methionine sulfoxide reductase msrA/msrB
MSKILIGLTVAAAAVAWFLVGAAEPPSYNQPKPEHGLAVATFAGGCFWCTESDFEKVPGVVKVISGYTGGGLPNPTYEQVSGGGTGHLESVQVSYDPQVITYDGLLQAFWHMVNPTDAGGQFVDRGEQYATAIFYHDEAQKMAAERSKTALQASGRYDKPVITPIRPAGEFY